MNCFKPCWALPCILTCIVTVRASELQVTVQKTPNGGIQPQAVIDDRGNLHLLYFQGEPLAGDLMYVRRDAGKTNFKAVLRVNSQPGSAVATGTIRGGHLAIGKDGRVHIAWNGSQKAMPQNPISGMPMLYARLNDEGTAFEPQRNLMTKSAILDGGGSVAADPEGNVYVTWHGLGQELAKGEGNRKVWVRISHDEGKTFDPEKSAWDEPTGACGCCGLRAFADQQGNAFVLYRAATESVNRGMYLLRSADRGKSFTGLQLDEWKIKTCPMSSESFARGPKGVYAAWESQGQIFFGLIETGKTEIKTLKEAPGTTGNRKHPALAVNKLGELILVWSEGTGWQRGGALAWQVYDKAGNPTLESRRRHGAIPVWSLPAAIAETSGGFTIFH